MDYKFIGNSSRKLIMLGGGGHCESVLDSALRMCAFDDIVILDPKLDTGALIMGCRVAGDDSMLKSLVKNGYHEVFISVGSIRNTAIRRRLRYMISELPDDLRKRIFNPNIIDPSAVISDHASLGSGIFVGKNAVINASVRIDDMAIINTGVVIEHGSHIGEYTHVAVGSVICGGCDIGSDVFIGAGTTVIQGIHMENNSFIQAGSVVLE